MLAESVDDRQVLEFLRRPKRLLIGSEWVEAASGRTFVDVDPATGDALVEVAAGDAEDVDAAVAAARRAFERGRWPALKPDERSRILWRIAEAIEEHADELALLDTLDNGKPLASARRIDVPAAAQMFRYWAGWPTKIEGATVPLSVAFGEYHTYTRREPLGVVGLIVPWNFPALFTAWKVAPALACGNTVVFKPAEETPLSALRIAELALEAGLPEGVLNVVTGFGETAGAAIAAHPDVDKVAFTGSVDTGKLVAAAALGNLKKVSLELGGKSPNVVFADADLDKAIPGAANAIFFNQGCVCAAGSRLYVHEDVFDAVVGGVSDRARTIRLGPGLARETEMGPLVSEQHAERVAGLVDSGLEEGATAAAGGRRPAGDGFFYEPTVLVDAKPEMRVVREEIFGPVVVAAPFRDVEDVLAQANDTRYGLAAGVWTRDVRKAHLLAAELKAGTVWVNTFNVTDPALPFGGFKQSGWGRDLGRDALELYTQTKAVCVRVV